MGILLGKDPLLVQTAADSPESGYSSCLSSNSAGYYQDTPSFCSETFSNNSPDVVNSVTSPTIALTNQQPVPQINSQPSQANIKIRPKKGSLADIQPHLNSQPSQVPVTTSINPIIQPGLQLKPQFNYPVTI